MCVWGDPAHREGGSGRRARGAQRAANKTRTSTMGEGMASSSNSAGGAPAAAGLVLSM